MDVLVALMIGDKLNIDLDFTVASYRFRLVEMIIVDAEIPNITAEFSDLTPMFAVSFKNARLFVSFAISVTQNKYPYFEDNGFGRLSAQLSLLIRGDFVMSTECAYTY